MSGVAPCPKRFSGTLAKPKLTRRLLGFSLPTALPSSVILVLRCSPFNARRNSSCPLPATPAIPTTSPPRTCRFIFRNDIPSGSVAGKFKSFTSKRISPNLTASGCSMSLSSSPIIIAASDCVLSSATDTVPIFLPRRRIVALWQSALISSSL